MQTLLHRNLPALALAVMAILFVAPLWLVTSPAMPDYPAHLASFQLIGASAAPDSFYAVHWHFMPNLASEIVVPLLARALPLAVAAKVFLSLTVLMWVTGAAAIQKALTGRIGMAALFGGLFVSNADFTWGFMNYTFATGLALLVFAAWVALRGRRTVWVVIGFTLAVSAVYVAHLFAACVLAALIGLYELTALLREEKFEVKALLRLWPLAVIFAPSAFAFLFFKSAGGEGGGVEFNFSDTVGDRVGSAMQWSFNEPAWLALGGLVILLLAGLVYGKARLHPAMKLTVLLLAVLTLVAPEWALGGWGVDLRLPPVLGVIVFASLQLRLKERAAYAAGALALAMAGINAATLTLDWQSHDRQYQEFRAAVADIPKGAKLFTVIDSNGLSDIADQPYWHMAEFAVLDRGAFTPLMFATKGQHILEVKPPYDQYAAATAEQGSPPDVSELEDLAAGREGVDEDIDEVFPYLKFFPCHFDYAVVVYGDGKPSDVPPLLQPVKQGSFFTLYKVQSDGGCPAP